VAVAVAAAVAAVAAEGQGPISLRPRLADVEGFLTFS